MEAFIDLGYKVNAIYLDLAKKLTFQVWCTNIGTLKIDDSKLYNFIIVIAFFQ